MSEAVLASQILTIRSVGWALTKPTHAAAVARDTRHRLVLFPEPRLRVGLPSQRITLDDHVKLMSYNALPSPQDGDLAFPFSHSRQSPSTRVRSEASSRQYPPRRPI